MESPETAVSQEGEIGSKRGPFPGRWLSFLLATALTGVASFAAFQQPLRPDPLASPALFSLTWWKYPIETNAVRRLTVIDAEIRDIVLVPKTNTLWVTGSGGLIASSSDGGRHWQKRSIVLAAPKVEPVETESADAQTNDVPTLTPAPTAAPTPTATPTRGPSKPQTLNLPANDFRYVSLESLRNVEAAKEKQLRPKSKPTPARSVSPAPRSQPTVQPSNPPTPPAQAVASASPSAAASPVEPPEPSDTPTPPAQAVTSDSPPPDASPESSPPGEVYPNLHAIWFEDENFGWVAGTGGAVARTLDGGQTWTQVSGGIPDFVFIAILFADEGNGWFLSPEGIFFRTNDGGAIWWFAGREPAAFSPSLHSAFLVAGDQAWGLGNDGALYQTDDKGSTWSKQGATLDTPGGIFLPLGANQGHIGWTRDAAGRPAKMRMVASRPQAAPVAPRNTNSILFSDDRIGWAVGDAGSIFTTNDAGRTWQTVATGPSSDIQQRLERAGHHRVLPAPWYLLSCLVALGLCVPMLRRPPSKEVEKSVADMLASDRPIHPGDPDPLQFNAVALGLSRFLRNRNTTPPLSIAITGEWGSGKSSLMNLLRGDLSSLGFRPVWFNPWHHQKEEHLLAALLENIQAQAIPNLFSVAGFYYRIPLLWFRAKRFWRISLLLAAILAFSVGYFAVDPGPRIGRAGDQLQRMTAATAGYVARIFGKEQPPSSTPANVSAEGPAALVLLTSIIGFLIAIVKGMKSFGVDPTSLLATSSGKPSLRALKAETSFRYRFARHFEDVTQALRACDYRTMLILIDDLDRCRPESVVETLEAINFLVTSGECFVVIGMARERVERCVGLAFKDLAEETSNASDHKEPAALKQRRIDFARQYLEKLINIEVPVPVATSEQSRELFAPASSGSKPSRWWENRFARKLARAAGGILLIGLLLGGVYLSAGVFFPPPDSSSGAVDDYTKVPMTTSALANLSTSLVADDDEAKVADPDSPPATLRPAKRSESSRSLLWFVVVLFFAIAVGQLFARPPVYLDDSDKFESALRTWHPLIAKRRNTPRSLKRFLNRLRYLAMRQSVTEAEPTLWERLWARVFGRPPAIPATVATGENRIDEDVLVGLAACRYLHPEEDMIVAVRKGVEALQALSPAESGGLEEWHLRQAFCASFPARANPHANRFETLHAGLYVY